MPDIAVTTATTAPVGGAAGQLLVKNSGADYDTTWASLANAAGGGVAYASKRWYDNRISTNTNSGGLALSAGAGYYLPYYTATAVTIDTVGVYCPLATANATTIKVGVLTATGSTYQPGAIIASTTLVAGGPAVGAFTAPLAATIPAGWSFLGVTAPAGLTIAATGQATACPWPNTVPGTLTIADQSAYLVTASGGLVANPAAPAPSTFMSVPLVYFRAA